MSDRPSAAERLGNPDAFLFRTDLRELGLERRAVGRHLPLASDRRAPRLLATADPRRGLPQVARRQHVWPRPGEAVRVAPLEDLDAGRRADLQLQLGRRRVQGAGERQEVARKGGPVVSAAVGLELGKGVHQSRSS